MSMKDPMKVYGYLMKRAADEHAENPEFAKDLLFAAGLVLAQVLVIEMKKEVVHVEA